MEYTKFTELIDGRLIDDNFVKSEINDISWEHFKLIKAGSERINYRCDFKNGKCFFQHHHTYDDLNTSTKEKMCCCMNCFNSVGHFRYLQKNDKKQLKLLAKKYVEPKNPKKLVDSGFWRVDKGCIFPRMYRSTVCLRYACNTSAMAEIDLFYLYRILSFYGYKKTENKLIEFMAKESNNQFLSLDEMSSLQKELAIDMLWKFVKQEFVKYKERMKLRKLKRVKRKGKCYATKRT